MKAGRSAAPLAAPEGARLRVVMLDTLSGTNDYTTELVAALARTSPQAGPTATTTPASLTVFTVQGSRIAPAPGLAVHALFPDFGAPRAWACKAWWTLRGYARFLGHVLRRPRDTVVHVQFLRHERLEAALLHMLQRLGVRVVHTAHNALPHAGAPWHRDFYRRWYGRVDAVQVLSRTVLEDIQHALGARARRWQIAGHGPYDGLRRRFAGLTQAQARHALGWNDERFTIVQFGLFKPYKGLSRLAAAVGALDEALRPRIALAGGGPAAHLRSVRTRLADSGRAVDLWWHDRFADDDTLCRLIVAADLVVFPYERVSQSGALVLALGFDKACLCSDLSGFREVLGEAAEAGALVDTRDPQAFAQALTTLMRSPARRADLQAACARAARALPAWDEIAAATWALWHEVRAAPRATPHIALIRASKRTCVPRDS